MPKHRCFESVSELRRDFKADADVANGVFVRDLTPPDHSFFRVVLPEAEWVTKFIDDATSVRVDILKFFCLRDIKRVRRNF